MTCTGSSLLAIWKLENGQAPPTREKVFILNFNTTVKAVY